MSLVKRDLLKDKKILIDINRIYKKIVRENYQTVIGSVDNVATL